MFRLFRYRSETPKQTEKKQFVGFAEQTEKQPKQIEFRFVSVRTENKFDCFEDTLGSTRIQSVTGAALCIYVMKG